MKKICSVLTVLVFLGTAVWAQDAATYPVTVTGDTTLVLKRQNSYLSPLDMPAAGIEDRAGASDREIQWFRAKANLNVSSGTPGETEWFGVVSLAGDFNSPDNINWNDDPDYANEDLKKVELSNAFAMWRPELLGGRPLGVAFGLYGIKQTANAAYSNIFSGDPDSDFPAYSIAALTSKPMINVDFHISGTTGVGVAFVKGGSDLAKIAGQFDEQTMMTGVAYAEAEVKGIGFNVGYQLSKGNKKEIRTTSSTEASEGTFNYVRFDPKYSVNVVNTQFTYKFNAGDFSAKPFAGYQIEFGQEALNAALPSSVDTRNTLVQVITGGAQLSYKIKGIPIRLSGEYSKAINEDVNPLDTLIVNGQLDTSTNVAAINSGITQIETALGVPAIAQSSIATGELSVVGADQKSKGVSAFAGLEGQYNLELAADVSPKVTISLFLNGQITKPVALAKVTAAQKAAIAKALKDSGAFVATGASQDALIDYVVDGSNPNALPLPASEGLVGSFEDGVSKTFDWTDTMSYGLSVTYRF